MQKSLIIDNWPGSKYASDSKANSLFIQVTMRILTGVDCNIANQINVRLKLTMSADAKFSMEMATPKWCEYAFNILSQNFCSFCGGLCN